ncbi:hypothetical protein, partial [Pseudomonas aeruginosa]|uniref:hypothetical protein n=1 Tax=Pseudomonas aeruginosa TaxID=287 RepID=UPI001F314895
MSSALCADALMGFDGLRGFPAHKATCAPPLRRLPEGGAGALWLWALNTGRGHDRARIFGIPRAE